LRSVPTIFVLGVFEFKKSLNYFLNEVP